MRAIELAPGDEVITTPYTFFATSQCILSAGALPVYDKRFEERVARHVTTARVLADNLEYVRDGKGITIEGLPTVTASLDFLPPPDFEAETLEEFMTIGHIITAVPALNAIPSAVAAAPGIITYASLDFPLPRGWVRH